MKKTVAVLLVVLLVLSFAACGKDDTSEEHVCAGANWVVEREASCTEEGVKNHVCSCGKVVATEKIAILSHSYEDGMCSGCLAEDPNYRPEPSQGLIYRSEKGGCAVVGLGSCTDSYVVIGDTSPDGVPIVKVEDYAFQQRDSVTKVYIGNNVTAIGERAFIDCKNLTTVRLGNSVQTVNSCAFINCTSLQKINLPDSLETLSAGAFYNCSALTEVRIPDSVFVVDDGLFQKCSSLKRVVLGNGVYEIKDQAFESCTSLKELVLPKNLRRINYDVFKGCSSLEAVYIEDPYYFGTISFMDQYANPLVMAGNLYINGELLTELVVPEDMAQYVYLQGCTSLVSITLPEGTPHIRYGAFDGCKNLKSINIPESVTVIGPYAFKNCSSLESIQLPEAITIIRESTFIGCSMLSNVTIPKNVETIGAGAFAGCKAFTEIVIPEKVTSLEKDAFANCTALTAVTINSSTVFPYNNQFQGCTALKTVQIPEENLSSYMSDSGWKKLLEPISETPGEDDPVVSGSEGLLFKTNKDGTCNVIGMGTCTDTVVIIPATAPNGETVVGIGNYAFAENNSITKVVMPDTMKNIGIGAFQKCSNLSTVELSQSLEVLESSAFEYCSSLSSLDLPATMKTLGKSAFRGSYNLKTLTIRCETVLNCPYYTMNDPSNDPSLNALYVPQSVVEEYKNAFNWAAMADKIHAITE